MRTTQWVSCGRAAYCVSAAFISTPRFALRLARSSAAASVLAVNVTAGACSSSCLDRILAFAPTVRVRTGYLLTTLCRGVNQGYWEMRGPCSAGNLVVRTGEKRVVAKA